MIEYLKAAVREWWLVFAFIIWTANGFDFLFETTDKSAKVSVEPKQEKKVEKTVDKNEIKTDW